MTVLPWLLLVGLLSFLLGLVLGFVFGYRCGYEVRTDEAVKDHEGRR